MVETLLVFTTSVGRDEVTAKHPIRHRVAPPLLSVEKLILNTLLKVQWKTNKKIQWEKLKKLTKLAWSEFGG